MIHSYPRRDQRRTSAGPAAWRRASVCRPQHGEWQAGARHGGASPQAARVASLAGPCLAGDGRPKPTHNVYMGDASGYSPPHNPPGWWAQQVHLSRGHWRREDAGGAIRTTGWWEAVTVTWSPAPVPGRRPAVLQRALAAAADMIAPVLADIAVASTRRLLDRRHRAHPVASSLQRQLLSATRELPRSDRTP